MSSKTGGFLMRKRFLSLCAVLVGLMLVSMIATPVFADTKTNESGGTGLDRWSEHKIVVQNGGGAITYFTSTVNLSAPRTISENYTFTGSLSVNHTNSYTNQTKNWVNLTITNESGTPQKSFSKSVAISSANGSSSFTIDTDFPKKDNCTLNIKFEHNQTSKQTSGDLNLTVVSNTEYMLGWTTVDLIASMIPLVVLIMIVGIVFKVLGESFSDMDSKSGGKGGSY